MKYVLIILVLKFNSSAVATVEFESELLCETAATSVNVQGIGHEVKAFCVPKGTE